MNQWWCSWLNRDWPRSVLPTGTGPQVSAARGSLAAFVIQQLLLHPVAAAIVPFVLFHWLSHFHPRPSPWSCRSWRWSFTIGQGNRYRGWKGSVCPVYYIQSNCPDWPGHVRCSGAHQLVTDCWSVVINLLCCHCIWSSMAARTLLPCSLSPSNLQHRVHNQWLMSVCWMNDQSKGWIWPSFLLIIWTNTK